jgi:chorismate synthase
MESNSFGRIFKLHSFGESHGKAIGGIIEGFPAGFQIDIADIEKELARRKTNQGLFSSQRNESDHLQILSGVFEGKTLGTPIGFIIENKDAKSKDYSAIKDIYRPSHADYTWEQKYGIRDYRGGGRSSARETISRVVAGAIAKQYLATKGIIITAWVQQIGEAKWENDSTPTIDNIEQSALRCPDSKTTLAMQSAIEDAASKGDSLGGIIKCTINNVPVGLGEPVFNKLHAALGNAMLGINAVKGFEYGNGFTAASLKGSQNNDEFYQENGIVKTITNNSGGIQGGISNGEEIYFRVAFKPVASINTRQKSIDNKGDIVNVEVNGRHDVCVVPRAVPIVESMAAMVILDFYLMQNLNRINQ